MMFLIYFLIAGIVLLLFWMISKDITWGEALLQLGIQSLLIFVMCLMIKNGHLSDTEILTGRITLKKHARVSCEHSYQCNCYESCSGSGNDRSCVTICQTCYDHDYDVDWFANTNIGRKIYINRVDRQGTTTPPRWTQIIVGEPAAFTHTYQNYIKADPESLFKYSAKELNPKDYPSYPGKVFDYYRIKRIISDINIDKEVWNKEIFEINADIGPAVQGNLILILTSKESHHAKAIQRIWDGGKKNDIIAVIGTDGSVIKWADIIGLSYPEFKVKLRNVINDYGKLDLGLLPQIKESILKDFKRRPMSEFEYLKESYKPTVGEWIFGAILSIIFSLGLGFFFHKQDVL